MNFEETSVKSFFYVALSLAVLFVLLIAGPVASSSTGFLFSSEKPYKLPAAQSITVPWGYFIPLEINSLSNSGWIEYNVTSNSTVSVALMNSNQFNIFNTSNTADISNSITYNFKLFHKY